MGCRPVICTPPPPRRPSVGPPAVGQGCPSSAPTPPWGRGQPGELGCGHAERLGPPCSVGQPSPAGQPAGPHCPGGGWGCCAGGDTRLLQGQIAPWLKREIIARLIASPAAGTSSPTAGTSSILHPEYFPLEPPRTVQLSQLPGNCLEKDFMVFYAYERKT